MSSSLTEKAKRLSISDRILLFEEIWNNIAEDNSCFELSKGQKEELDRRLASVQAQTPHKDETSDEINPGS